MKSALLAIAVLSFAACATRADPIPGPVTTIDTTPPGKETENEQNTPPPAPAPLPPDDPTKGECKGETTQTACFQCCDDKHPDGAGAFYVALFDCICQPQNCKNDCSATICNDTSPAEPDGTCNACMAQKNVACQQPVADACNASPDCIAYDKCVSTSGCAAKKHH